MSQRDPCRTECRNHRTECRNHRNECRNHRIEPNGCCSIESNGRCLWFWRLVEHSAHPRIRGLPKVSILAQSCETPGRPWPAVSTNWQLHLSQSRAMLPRHPSIHNPPKRAPCVDSHPFSSPGYRSATAPLRC